MDLREALFEPANEVQKILEWQVGMQAAHNVELGDRVGISRSRRLPGFFQRHGVGTFTAVLTAESAEPAGRDANVGGINVAVDVEVSDVTVQTLAHLVGQPSDGQHVARAEE